MGAIFLYVVLSYPLVYPLAEKDGRRVCLDLEALEIDMTIIVVGETSAYVDGVIEVYIDRGMGVVRLEPDDLDDFDWMEVDGLGIVVFYGDWLASHVSDPRIAGFIAEIEFDRIGLVAIDGNTSSLFTLLDMVGIYKLVQEGGVKWNPAYSNPHVVGYMHLEGVMPNGSIYYFPSILMSNSRLEIDAAIAIANWMAGEDYESELDCEWVQLPG